jgi:predicted dehydrogenase
MRWGILGAGRVAADFTSSLRTVAAAAVTAVAASSVDKAQRFASEHGLFLIMRLLPDRNYSGAWIVPGTRK